MPGLIDRHDLVAALDRAAEKKVTVISAPAGSGKTTLLRLWTGRPGPRHRIAFVTGQRDTQQFWLDLLGAVGGDVAPTPAFTGDAMATKVLSAIGDDPVVLVIDDLHEVASPEQLSPLLTNLPPHAHAIVASRHDPPLRLHRLRLAGELAEIRAAQLRFTQEETRELVATARLRLPDHVTTLLHQRTEGWAAGLRLAVLSLAGHPDPERFVAEFSGSDRTVAEYLTAEMLERQPAEVQRLLLRTSVLDRVNGELADLLTGLSGSARILLDLEDANAFVVSLDPGRTWFRYHHLFAGLLRLALRRTQAEEIPSLHRLAARWFAEHARPADAIRHLQAAGDWTEAARLLTDHALSMTLDGQAGTVTALLRAMPADESPELALVHAIAELDQMRLDEAAAHLEIARSHTRLRMAVTSLDLLLARLRGHFDGMCAQVDALPPITGRSTAEIAVASDLRAIALLNIGVTEAWALRLADSEKHLQEGADLARDIGRPYLEVACRAHLGFAATGHSFALARQRSEEAIALAAQHDWDTEPVIAPAQATLAGTLIWTGEFDHGEQWLDRARHATRSGGEPGIRLLVHLVSATLHAARGHHRQALAEFVAAGQVPMVGQHALAGQITAWTIATQARCGMLNEARAALAATNLHAGELRNATAVLRLAEGNPAAARHELEPIRDGIARVEAHLLEALACRDLGDQPAARAAIEQALDLAERDRLILPFAMTGAWELLESLPGTAHAALVADILDAVRHGAPPPPTLPPAEELSPSELRVLRYLPTNLTRPEIAGQLSISLNTVNTHIRRIYAKLGTTDRSAAVQRGRELRLLSAGRT